MLVIPMTRIYHVSVVFFVDSEEWRRGEPFCWMVIDGCGSSEKEQQWLLYVSGKERARQ